MVRVLIQLKMESSPFMRANRGDDFMLESAYGVAMGVLSFPMSVMYIWIVFAVGRIAHVYGGWDYTRFMNSAVDVIWLFGLLIGLMWAISLFEAKMRKKMPLEKIVALSPMSTRRWRMLAGGVFISMSMILFVFGYGMKGLMSWI